jgi:hypothetical protein
LIIRTSEKSGAPALNYARQDQFIQNAYPNKEVIALGQIYFAIRTP